MKDRGSFFFVLVILVSLNSPNACHSAAFDECSLVNLSAYAKAPQCIRFTTTFESFFPLVDEEYWMRAARYPHFQENISLSMYRYYMAQHLYSRLAEIRATKYPISPSEVIFSRHVKLVAPVLPLAILTYLGSIGDVKILENRVCCSKLFYYHSVVWPNDNGDFGRVNSGNHWMYMSLPAPAVVAQVIQEDFLMENNESSKWNLKSHLMPSINEGYYAGLPTANLLGWKTATLLTTPQRQNLYLCGVNYHHFDVINSQFQFNPRLMKIIYKYLQAYPQATGDLRSQSISQAVNFGAEEQLGWLQRLGQVDEPTAETFISVDKSMQAMVHPLQPNAAPSRKLAQILGFRVDKSGSNDWSIYSWNDYREIPVSWNATKNSVFAFGDIGNVAAESTALFDYRDQYRAEFLEDFF